MASIIDEWMARKGTIDEAYIGINQCKAADMVWDRERGETEAAFLARCRRDAALAGYRVLCVSGHLMVGTVNQFSTDDCDRLGVGWVP